MKRRSRKLAVMAILTAVTFSSCCKTPMNPEEIDFAAASFNVQILETRCYAEYSYSIPQDEAPIVTYWNTVTVKALSDDPAFNGVNAASDNTRVVTVTRTDDPSVYSLTYQADGNTDIRIWNAREEKTFRIEAQHTIELEGILMRVAGKEFVVKADSSLPGPYENGWLPNDIRDDQIYFSDLDYDEPYEVEIVDLVPSNASWRIIERLWVHNTPAGEMQEWFDPEYKEGGSFVRTGIRDASFITGRKASFWPNIGGEQIGKSYFFIMSFRTNCKDYKTPPEQVRFTTMFCGWISR